MVKKPSWVQILFVSFLGFCLFLSTAVVCFEEWKKRNPPPKLVRPARKKEPVLEPLGEAAGRATAKAGRGFVRGVIKELKDKE